jgi:acyl-CoA thioesterase-1
MNVDMRKSPKKSVSQWLSHLTMPVIVGAALLAALTSQALAASPANISNAARSTVLIVGDSLSAEYGIARGTGWVSLLEQQVQEKKINAKIINAAISGDTSSGGLARLPALLDKHKPTLVVIELGGNDALRGFLLDQTEKNMTQMIVLSKKVNAKVLLLGMQIPPNFGAQYANDFIKMYQRLAISQGVALVPFLLKDVNTFQADGIHPTSAAQPIMLRNVLPSFVKLLR